MTKLFACLALFCLIGTAFSAAGDACVENSLLGIYGFDPDTTEEFAGTDLKFCKSLQGGTSCCEAAIVDKFQDDIDTLAETFADSVIIRDKFIIDLKKSLTTLNAGLTALQTNAEDAITAIDAAIEAEAGAGGGDPEDEPTVEPYSLADAKTLAENLFALSEEINDELADATTGFTAFQTARGACIVEFLGLQAAAWCLACDPTAADQGVGANGAIEIADATCTRLKGACYDYVTASVSQSAILSVGWVNTIIDDLNTALEAVVEDDADEASRQLLSSAVEPAEDLERDWEVTPVATPEGCTSEADCDWICTALFSAGEITEGIILGGSPTETPLVETTAVEAGGAGGRLLQGSWEPAADEAGVTITWKNDPADVNSEDDIITLGGAGIVKSGFVCVIALLSVFFF